MLKDNASIGSTLFSTYSTVIVSMETSEMICSKISFLYVLKNEKKT